MEPGGDLNGRYHRTVSPTQNPILELQLTSILDDGRITSVTTSHKASGCMVG
jgi:hypothetical protein